MSAADAAADTAAHAHHAAAGGLEHAGQALGKKVGPLPLGVWLVLTAGGVLYVVHRRNAPARATAGANDAASSSDGVTVPAGSAGGAGGYGLDGGHAPSQAPAYPLPTADPAPSQVNVTGTITLASPVAATGHPNPATVPTPAGPAVPKPKPHPKPKPRAKPHAPHPAHHPAHPPASTTRRRHVGRP